MWTTRCAKGCLEVGVHAHHKWNIISYCQQLFSNPQQFALTDFLYGLTFGNMTDNYGHTMWKMNKSVFAHLLLLYNFTPIRFLPQKPVLQVTLKKCLAFFDWLMYFQKWKLWFMDFFPEQRFQQIPKSWKRVQNVPSNSRRNVLPIFQKLRREGLGLHWLNCTTQQARQDFENDITDK